MRVPKPPENSFDPNAAERGKEIFNNQADCSRCHVPPLISGDGGALLLRQTDKRLGLFAGVDKALVDPHGQIRIVN